jgi:Ca2+-binding EF-hand superfamily protein
MFDTKSTGYITITDFLHIIMHMGEKLNIDEVDKFVHMMKLQHVQRVRIDGM